MDPGAKGSSCRLLDLSLELFFYSRCLYGTAWYKLEGLARVWVRSLGNWVNFHVVWASLLAQTVKICLRCRRPGFHPWVGKIPWRRQWLPTPVFTCLKCLEGLVHVGLKKKRKEFRDSEILFLATYFLVTSAFYWLYPCTYGDLTPFLDRTWGQERIIPIIFDSLGTQQSFVGRLLKSMKWYCKTIGN